MPYTQYWGVSRNAFQSPLSYGSIGKYTPKPKKKEEIRLAYKIQTLLRSITAIELKSFMLQ